MLNIHDRPSVTATEISLAELLLSSGTQILAQRTFLCDDDDDVDANDDDDDDEELVRFFVSVQERE